MAVGMAKTQYLRLRLNVLWWGIADWFARWIHAQHNARVIVDFERRMSIVIHAATRGRMSKSYYTADVMTDEIEAAFRREFDEGYAEGRRDLAEELGMVDPTPFEPER